MSVSDVRSVSARMVGGCLAFLLLGGAVWAEPSGRVRELLNRPALERRLERDDPDDRLFWQWSQRRAEVSERERLELWAACQRHPGAIERHLEHLPDRADVDDWIHAHLAEIKRNEATRAWLRRRGRYLREELVACAAKGSELDLLALLRLDRPLGATTLAKLADSPLRSVIRCWLDPSREELRRPVEAMLWNRKTKGETREMLCRVLGQMRWSGQEAWMRKLWSLGPDSVSEGHLGFAPLSAWVAADPDRWVPLMISWLNDKNRQIHDNAVSCLVQFHLDRGREDAMRALLPWLKDPKWSSARDRLRLIQTLEQFEIPEAIPGLLSVVASNQDGSERGYAAETLAHYRPAGALPVLRSGLGREKTGYQREHYLKALMACGGFSLGEQLQALRRYAKLVAAGEVSGFDLPLLNDHPKEELGAYVAAHPQLSPEWMAAVSTELAELRVSSPKAAVALEGLICKWRGELMEKFVLDQVVSDRADAVLLAKAMELRANLAALGPERLKSMLARGGEQAGIAACLLDLGETRSTLLRSGDEAACNAVLALARLQRLELDLKSVAVLKNKAETREAAVAYLTALDSADSRLLLQEKGRILGSSGGELAGIAPDLEASMQAELDRSSDCEEMFGLFTTGYYESYGHFLVRKGTDGASFVWTHGGASYRSRKLSAQEFSRLKSFVEEQKVDSLPKLNELGGHGCEYQYCHLTRQGGFRVYAYAPGKEGKSKAYWQLTELFKGFRKGETELHYQVIDRLGQGRVLFDASVKGTEAVAICGDAKGVAIRLSEPLKLPVELLNGQALKKFNLKPSGGVWYDLNSRGSGSAAWQRGTAPAIWLEDDKSDLGKEGQHLNSVSWMCETGAGRLRVDSDAKSGLYLSRAGHKPKQLVNGTFASPVVARGGRWAIASRAESGWLAPNEVVRIDLSTGKVSPVAIARAENLYCLAFIPERGFLVFSAPDEPRRAKAPKGRDPECFLVDPASGRVQPVKGEFSPCHSLAQRPLQPTGKAGEFWAARPTTTKSGMELGRYRLGDFQFTAVRSYAGIRFDSSSI